MRARTRTARAFLLATIVAVGVAGCGGGNGGSDGDDKKDGESASGYELGPLDEFYEAAYGEWDEDESVRQSNRVEELVAECMAEQGFDYTPVDQSQYYGDSWEPEELDVEWGTIEFAEQYGYGITTNPWDRGSEEDAAAEPEFEDPNQEYVESMSEGEQQAYYEALWGVQEDIEVTDEGDEAEYEYDWKTAGCQGAAQHEVFEGGEEADEFADLNEEMSAIWETVESDPRIAELNTTWASCMADAGHTGYAAVGDAENELHEQVNALWEEQSLIGMDPDAEFDEAAWAAAEKEIAEKTKEFTPREIELATADFTCREKVKYDDTRMEIDHDYQQKFVDEHRTELEAWAESMKASRS